jgi:S1-C subfamily serine protease
MHTTIAPNTFGFAVISANSAQPELVARVLVEKGYQVVLGSGVEQTDTRVVAHRSTLLVTCQYLGHTGNFLTGTSANVSCAISDLANGTAVFNGTGKHMGVLTEGEDIRGAVQRALADFPGTGRVGGIAQVGSIPRVPGGAVEPSTPSVAGPPRIAGTGTGFFVDTRGFVLTNAHVVEGCGTVRQQGQQLAMRVFRVDRENDLAILQSTAPPTAVAQFREGRGIRSGDMVVVVGYPLAGVLASEANVTTGTVSALAGLGDDFRFLQITAPVQPGNSGGPLLDASGNVVGIVTSKLDALRLARITGDIPQNINFALNASVARILMDAVGVQYVTATPQRDLSAADIGESAKAFTVLIECWR